MEVVYVVAKRGTRNRTQKKLNRKVVVEGKTEEGMTVVSNVFRMLETQGVPLDLIVDTFHNANITIDWISFYNEAKRSGWGDKTILDRIKYSLFDVFGQEHSDIVVKRLKEYIVLMSDP